MTVKLLTEQHFEFLSLKGSCTGSDESKLVKMPYCWKSCVTALLVVLVFFEATSLSVTTSVSEVPCDHQLRLSFFLSVVW